MADNDILLRIEADMSDATKKIGDLTGKIAELKKYEDSLNKSLQKEIEEHGENSEKVDELRQRLAEATEAKKAYKKEIGEVSRNVQNAIVSDVEYQNTLKGQCALLSQLKDQLRAMPLALDANGNVLREQGKEFTDLQNRIKLLSDSISEQEQRYGQYSRNVGNYANSIADALGGVGGKSSTAVNGIRNMTGAFKVMSTTPVIAILGIIINALDKLKSSLNSSEEGSNRLTQAFASFKSIGDLLTNVMQTLGNVIAWVVEKASDLFKRITANNDAFKELNKTAEERNKLAGEEIELNKEQRDTSIQVAETEKEVAELRAKASDKSKYSAQERLAFLQEALQKEADISKKNKEIAEKEYDLIKRKNALTKSSKEDLDKEAQAKIKAINAEKAYFEAERSMQKQIQSAMKEIEAERKAQIKEAQDQQREAITGYAELITELTKMMASDTEKKVMSVRENYKKLALQIRDSVKAGTMSMEEANYYRVLLSQKMADEIAEIEKKSVETTETAEADLSKERAERLKNDLILAWDNADAQYRIKREYLEKELELEKENAVRRAELEKQLDELNAQYNQNRIDRVTDFTNQCLSLVSGMNEVLSNSEDARLQKAEYNNTKQKESLDARLKAGLISQKTYDANVAKLDKELDAEKAEITRKQAIRERSLALFQVAVNTAQAIAKIWAEVPKADFGVSTGILTAMAVAMGVTQAGAIVSAPMPKARKGGLVQGATHEQGGVLIEAEGGERIIANNPSRAFPELLNLISYIGKNVPDTQYAYRQFTGRNDNSVSGMNLDYQLMKDAMKEAVQEVQVYLSLSELREAEQTQVKINELAKL